MREDRTKRAVNMYLDKETVKQIDRLAKKVGISRSRLTRNLLLMGLDDAKVLDAFGLFTLIRKMEALRGDIEDEDLEEQPA